jgi:hypothetical protein
MVNDLTNPADKFNQISALSNDGYIVLSQGLEPYLLYEYQNLDNLKSNPHIVFNIPKCMEDNGIRTNFIDNINKVLLFDELLGVCDHFDLAYVLLSFDIYNLSNDTTYVVRLSSGDNNISIDNSEFLIDNTNIKQTTFSANIKFLNQINYTVFHVYASLYENEILLDKDVISIMVNCPQKPSPTPLPKKITANISIL